MDLLGSIVDFMNEPIPSYFFEVLVLDDPFDADDPFAMMSATASLAIQALDPTSCAFKSVEGFEMTLSTNPHNEGGWSIPRPMFSGMNNAEITLTRYLRPRHVGIMGFSFDPFSGWCQDTIQAAKKWNKKIKTKDILIFIYHPMIQNPLPVGPASFPVAGFLVQEAFPTKWSLSSLDSMNEGEPITEIIGLQCTELQRLAVPPA